MQVQLAKKEELRQKKLDKYWENELKLVFNDIADRYDTANDFFSFGFWNKIRRRFIEMVDLAGETDVLDVCAGTNAVGIDLLTKTNAIVVTAVDRSEEMQRIGAMRAAEKGFFIKSVISDAHELPFSQDCFDIVTLEAATRHLEVKKVFGEIYRVLRPGGFFYHCDLVKPKNPVVSLMYSAYLRIMIPITTIVFFRRKEFLGIRERALKLTNYFIEAINIFYTADELSVILKDIGFKDVESISMAAGTVAVHKARK